MDGIYLISYDRRCAGGSSYSDADFTLSDLARDIVDLLDYLRIEQATLAAASAGGPIALRTALDYPNRVKRIALLGTGPGLLAPDPAWLLWPRSAFALDRLATVQRRLALLDEAAERGVTAAVRATEHEWRNVPLPPRLPQAALRDFQNRADALGTIPFPALARLAHGAIRNMRAQADADLSPELHRVNCPVRVWHSADDTVVPFEFGQALANGIPGAEMVNIPGAVHGLIDDPQIQRELVDWINEP